ncbi:MAG: ABC transporter substrate-binding protein [Chloroflexales bacterium]|nr:ABC transporter substrate-binding protein [Chloroflexales bacterium]
MVACSDEAVDIALALGIQPIGICSARVAPDQAVVGEPFKPAAYFFDQEKLGAPVFVGSSLVPSIERLVALKPDLIIITSDSDKAYDQLAQVAPVLYLDMATSRYWRETLGDVAKATGRTEQAEQFLSEYDATVARAKAALEPVVQARPTALAIYSFSPEPQMMLFRQGTWLSKGLEQMGFTIAEPEGVEWGPEGWSIVSTEFLSNVRADLIVVLRSPGADGAIPRFPMDDITDKLSGTHVVLQPLDPTRASSAPLTDKFVIEQYEQLLGGNATLPTQRALPVAARDGGTR